MIHLYPRTPYKCWTTRGWVAALRHVTRDGLPVVLTGGGDRHERHYVETILARDVNRQAVNLTGQISLPQVSDLLGRCALYVGPDTGITHLASARGAPTVALFGPTDPVYWGPWPAGYAADASPYVPHGCQRIKNVFIVQRHKECGHRGMEGCEDDPHRPSRCMQELEEDVVLNAIDEMLKVRPGPSGKPLRTAPDFSSVPG